MALILVVEEWLIKHGFMSVVE